MRLRWAGVSKRMVVPFTARCIGCRGVFRVPSGHALTVDHLFAHECEADDE